MQYGIFKTATAFGSALLSVWLIAGRGMGWRGVVWSQVMSTGVAGAIGLYILISNREIAFKWDMPYIKAALRFGLPLIPHAFGGWLMMSADRLLINRMVSVTATGLYTVAFQVTSAITMLQISFNTAYVPWLFERLKRNDLVEEKLIVKLTYRYVGTMFIGSLVFGLIAPEIFQFAIGKNYHGASRFILWIAPAKGIEAMYYMTCNYIFYSTKTKYLALATIISAVIHMGVAYLLIGRFGAIGAAQATLISSVVLVMIVWWVAAKLHPMPWLINGRRRNAIG
jgi:O-antigen/teichoic acid export membrane protein